jgi:ParB-like chromosome segregation protein Spo0J
MDQLKFHPTADIFPLMEGEELDALVADIKEYGVREKIVLFEGKILDGRNRYRACLAAGIEPGLYINAEGSIDDPVAYVISKNIHRRHLTAGEKLDIIASLIKAQPEKSDRSIAATAKASPTTVGKKRAEMEAKGEVSTVDTRTDARGVKQPAKKRASTKATKRPSMTALERNGRDAFLLDCEVAADIAGAYAGPINDEVRQACRRAADAFAAIADKPDRDAAAAQAEAA